MNRKYPRLIPKMDGRELIHFGLTEIIVLRQVIAEEASGSCCCAVKQVSKGRAIIRSGRFFFSSLRERRLATGALQFMAQLSSGA